MNRLHCERDSTNSFSTARDSSVFTMRDIPKINYNTTSKTKKVANENDSSRAYKDFLEHYNNVKNTKDDQESVSSVDSGISESKSYSTSTSSLNSEPAPKGVVFSNGRAGSFRKYMENYNTKKFSSVKPNLANKPSVVKSEIVIQVNSPLRTEDADDLPPPPSPSENYDVARVTDAMPPPPPPPLALAPPPPPMPCAVDVPAKKWATVETEHHQVPVRVRASTGTNLADVLTQNALFQRKAHESETSTEETTVTDFRVCDAKPPKPHAKNDVQKHVVKPFVNHRTITVEVPLNSAPSLNDVDFDTTTVVPITDRSAKVNTNDPNVKKMVYSTYRGLLGAYNNKANGMIATLPRTMVREDRGITRQLESIADFLDVFVSEHYNAQLRQAAAPPPPPGATGNIPSTRLKSEISDRRDPPACVQNAMLTKDKKPFTYTPGGIDLSEIRSPRMARRLERNAMNEGVTCVPQTTYQPTGPLPPSALAAMQPQLPVQVFPPGGIPPPPPQSGPPPPPPPPAMKTSPLPTDHFNRPDMTKIIPENPMSMLRKTSGPVVKQDPILNKGGLVVQNNNSPPIRQQPEPFVQNTYTPNNVQPMRQPSFEAPLQNKSTAGVGSIYVPPVTQKSAETPPTSYTPPAYYKRQPSTPQHESPKPSTPESPKPTLSKAPTPWLTQRRQLSQEVPEWAVNDQRVQSPSVNQEPYRDPPQQQRPVRPWQQQQQQPQQQPEVYQPHYHQPQMQPLYQEQQPHYHQPQMQPVYQEQQPGYNQRQPQQFWTEPPQQQHQPVGGVRRQIQTREKPQEYYPPERTEVVIVNDPPQVYHHPGQRGTPRVQHQHQHQVDNGVRIIPVQIEGRSNGHQNSDARSFNRQLSWNSTPTQSNTFRVLQKITQTDGADDENQIISEHSPKMYQQFPQRQTSMEGRKWNQNDSDQALMGSFKQGFDEGSTLHNEVDPRYRGPHIPSKAFRLLQNMTGGPESSSVPQAPPSHVSGPKVRTIPIQIEGNGQAKNYVPPSEQIVQEPKKYMGSSIPSRSFKILQAMTAPDACVNPDQACENNENYSNEPSSYTQWGFDPNRPPPSPYCFDPYWSYYAQSYYPPNYDSQDPNSRIPPWQFYPPYCYPPKDKNVENKRSQRTTPVPWQNEDNAKALRAPTPSWPFFCAREGESKKDSDSTENYVAYPPYWNPYYYNYYYGVPPPMYPPVYSPYHFYPPQNDSEEVSGYSSNEEMAYYGARFATMPPFARPKSSIAQKDPAHVEPASKADDDAETSDSDTEMISYEVCRNTPGLQTIRSVSDVKVYQECSDDESESTTEENDDSCNAEDVIPHQLSVIFEESEKTDSIRLDRESSVSTTISEGTATVENSEEEAEESDGTVFVKLPLTFKFVVAETQKVATITVGNSEIVPQAAVQSSAEEEEYCDNLKTEPLHLDNKENTANDTESVDWWHEISQNGTTQNEAVEMNELQNSESGIDFWAHLNRDASTTQIYSMSKKLTCDNTVVETAEETETKNNDDATSEIDFWAEIINDNVTKASGPGQNVSSTCSSDSSLSSSTESKNLGQVATEVDSIETNADEECKVLTIQERIKSLQDCGSRKKSQDLQEAEIKISIKDRISQLQGNCEQLNVEETCLKTNSCSRKSSIKSYEGYSEEDGDSGVTSDVSRHVSEFENDLEFFETKKGSQYQRASTHSRLFKLLQDECDDGPEESVDDNKTMTQRRDCLTLPLAQPGSDPESFSSSGFTSPGSPTINDKIVNDIVQKLIMRKQGKAFKNINMEKVQAAALRILQEDMDGLETLSSSEEGGTFFMPKKGEIAGVPNAYISQECYERLNDYSQYYDTWGEAEKFYDGYDIVPSKAFKLLQEHSAGNRTGAITGLLARCPRVLSNKNVQKELMKLIESQGSPSPSPEPPETSPNVNEATSAS